MLLEVLKSYTSFKERTNQGSLSKIWDLNIQDLKYIFGLLKFTDGFGYHICVHFCVLLSDVHFAHVISCDNSILLQCKLTFDSAWLLDGIYGTAQL